VVPASRGYGQFFFMHLALDDDDDEDDNYYITLETTYPLMHCHFPKDQNPYIMHLGKLSFQDMV
jgi:hypothetical protein